jgi:hypothetical protein
MKKELVDRFWEDFHITTQDQFPDVAFANPIDVASSLIKARNWSATLTQELVKVIRRLSELKLINAELVKNISTLERDILSRQARASNISAIVVKNKDLQRAFIRSVSTEEELGHFAVWEEELHKNGCSLLAGETYKEQVEALRKTLERSTDWLVQYINWCKFEAKSLSD